MRVRDKTSKQNDALQTPSAPDAESAAPRRAPGKGSTSSVLCCYALSTACLALGYALGDWRLVAGGVAGLGVERARRAPATAALLVHARPRGGARRAHLRPDARGCGRRRTQPTAAAAAPKPSTPLSGALGLDDDSAVGWPADLVDFDEAQIRERHPALAADVDAARARRAPGSLLHDRF